MATATQSKKSQVLEYLHSGRGLTASQARKMFGVANFRATMSSIKEQVERYGNWRIVTSDSRDGETRYSLKRVRLVGPSNYTVGNH